MKSIAACCVVVCGAAAWGRSLPSGGARLADGGRTEYSIVVNADAPLPDRFAAEEMQTFLEESTGARFQIVSPGAGVSKSIEIGTARARKIVGETRSAGLRDEESVYVVKDGVVAIVGGGATGNAYGVYSFLEQEVGCRWFSLMGENLVPRHDTLDIHPKTYVEKPRLEYRDILCMGMHWDKDSKDMLFLYRNRLNQGANNFTGLLRKDLEGKLVPRMKGLSPSCHSLYFYVPPRDTKDRKGYFKEHPEYFTMNRKGERVVSQLCFSNPELRRVLTENFMARARQQGGKGFIDISAQDDSTDAFCYCPECLAITEKHKSIGAPLFDFLLELAPKAKKEFPDLTIHFLVYRESQTQTPPVGMPERWPDNLAAVFAPIDNDFSKDYLHKNNARAYSDLKAWCRMVRTWTWYYPQPYAPGRPPFGGLERTWTDTRLAIEAGLVGAFYEHDVGTNQGAGFADMQTWMLLQHFRNPDRDWRDLRREFCDFYYGPAADDMEAYDEDLERLRREYGFQAWHLPMAKAFTSDNLLKWNAIFDRMEAAVASDAVRLQHVREVRMGLDYQTLMGYRALVREHPEFSAPATNIHARAMSTLDNALKRRYTDPNSAPTFFKAYRPTIDTHLDLGLVMAAVDPKPLPAEFAGIPEGRIRQVIAERAYSHMKRVKMEDAATGFALCEKDAGHKVPFQIAFRDFKNKKNYVDTVLQAKDLKPGKFHFYKVGRVPIPNEQCKIVIGRSGWNVIFTDRLYIPGNDDLWDLWVSLKFDGPLFDKSSSLEESNVYFDRAVFVGPFPKD